MTYNAKQGCSDRHNRRTKRKSPEKKSPTRTRVSPKHPTKPKNHNKIAELKAIRGQHIKDDIDYDADIDEPEYKHREPQYRVVGYILENGNIIPKNGRYVWSIEFTDDFHSRRGPFSICSSEWCSYYLE